MPMLGRQDDDNTSQDSMRNRIAAVEAQARQALTVARASITTSAKRFRIGVATVPFTLLGGQVSVTVVWSTPITNAAGDPVDAYNVDAACTAFPGMPIAPALSNQTSTGVTVTFTAPVLIAAGTVVVVLGVAPAPPTA